MDEGRKRVIGIIAAILASLHMERADDLFGGPEGSPRTDRLISASIQWAERIMQKIDDRFQTRLNLPLSHNALTRSEATTTLRTRFRCRFYVLRFRAGATLSHRPLVQSVS